MTTENINKFEKYLEGALIGIVAILIYFILPNVEGIFLKIFNIEITSFSTTFKIIYSTIYDILMMCLIVLLFYKTLKKDFIDIRKSHKTYYQEYFKYYLIALLIMMISNVIISIIGGGSTAGNQEAIENLFQITPFYVYFSAVIFAPIVEELIFRKAIYNIIPNKFLFIITSGLVFGGLHILGSIESWTDFLYIIPYSSLGVAFAYIYTKTKNIFVSMGLHFMHNGILIALQFIVLLFG